MNREKYEENHCNEFVSTKYICHECEKIIEDDEYADFKGCLFHIKCLINIFYNHPEETDEDLSKYEINSNFDRMVFAEEEVTNKYKKLK